MNAAGNGFQRSHHVARIHTDALGNLCVLVVQGFRNLIMRFRKRQHRVQNLLPHICGQTALSNATLQRAHYLVVRAKAVLNRLNDLRTRYGTRVNGASVCVQHRIS